MFEESGFGGITEHLTALKEPKLVLPKRIALFGGAALLIVGLLVLAAKFGGLLPLFVLLIAGTSFLAWFLWRYTDVEYEYLIAQGEMSFAAVYGKRSRRDLFEFSLKEAERVVPYAAEKAACDGFPADETRFYAASYGDENTFCALICREDGRKVRLFFQATPAALAAIRRANPRAVGNRTEL